MPPEKKITKEQVIKSAFNIVKENGIRSLNARALANTIGCSTQPIFSCFSSMDDLKREVLKKSLDVYHQMIAEALKSEHPYKATGLAYIHFAKDYPNLFKATFMSDKNDRYDNITIESKDDQDLVAFPIMKSLNISFNEAKEIQLTSWIFVHGIATMLAMKTVSFDDEIISTMLTKFYKAISASIKGDK